MVTAVSEIDRPTEIHHIPRRVPKAEFVAGRLSLAFCNTVALPDAADRCADAESFAAWAARGGHPLPAPPDEAALADFLALRETLGAIFSELVIGCDPPAAALAALPALAALARQELATMGALFSAISSGVVLAQFVAGPASDRYGQRVAIGAGLLLMGAGTLGVGIGLAFWPMLACSLLLGFGFGNLNNDECLSQSGVLAGPWTVVTAPCDGTDKQRWKLESYTQGGADASFPVRLHNAAENFCVYTDLTGQVYGTALNCGLAGTESNRKVGLYFGGAFDMPPYMP